MDRLISIALGLFGIALFSVAEFSCTPILSESSVLGYVPSQMPNYDCILVTHKPDEPFEKNYSQSIYFLTNNTVALGSATVSPSPSSAPPETS